MSSAHPKFRFLALFRHFCVVTGSPLQTESGYSLIEVLVTLGLTATMLAAAVPSISDMQSQISVSQDSRHFAQKVASWRTEAVRLRRTVSLSFTQPIDDQPGSYSVDYDSDGMLDETVKLSKHVHWLVYDYEMAPWNIQINGFGLPRFIGPTGMPITLERNNQRVDFVLNSTGLITFN